MMRLRLLTSGLICLMLIAGLSFPLGAQSNKQLYLESADILRNVTNEDGTVVRKLTGNVHFRRGEVDLYCTDAISIQQQNLSKLWGNVRVYGEQDTLYADTLYAYSEGDTLLAKGNSRLISEDRVLTSDRIRYIPDLHIAQAIGQVRMTGEQRTITADSVWYETEEKQAEIYGTVDNPAVVYDEENLIRISGPVISQNLDTEVLRAIERPTLTKLDSAGQETVNIISNILITEPDSGKYIAQENVIITRDSMRAETNLATLFENDDFAILEESPVVYYTDNTIRGDKIHLYFSGDKLEQVYIPNNADLHSIARGFIRRPLTAFNDTSLAPPADTVYSNSGAYGLQPVENENVLRGKELTIWIENNHIDNILVSGMAQSTYHVYEDSIYQGINETSGDTIKLAFATPADSLEQIDVIGGTIGNFKPHASNTSVDTTVFYEADHLIFQVPERITKLQYEANAKYQDMSLDAAFINVLWKENLLVATPLPADADTNLYKRNTPTFTQSGREPMTGRRLEYNLDTRQGEVTYGQTHDAEGFYTGQRIHQRGQETLYVRSGMYTTCDLQDPHFHFQSRRMKLIVKEKVIAKPIVLYIHDVPVFALPFGLFPQKKSGRSSGYIIPTWGESSFSGRFLKGLGYYWAPSEYWDYELLFDFWEKRGVSFRNRLRYNKRYRYNGNVSVVYDREFFTPEKSTNYRVNITHSQTIDPTMDLRVNGSFVSSSQFVRETNLNRQDRLQQQIISNATLSKRWENTKNSVSVNLNRREDLQSGNISETLPQLSFRRGTDKLFKAPQSASFQVKNRWYYNINYSYSANLRNQHTKELQTDSLYTDPYGITRDLGRDSTFVDLSRQAVQHSLSFQTPLKVLKFFTFNPRLSVSEDWVPQYREAITQNGTVAIDPSKVDTLSDGSLDYRRAINFRVVDQFAARHTFSFSTQMTTKLYGLFPIRIGALQGLRHVLTPSVSYNIGPDFSREFYGYYQYARLPDGSEEKFDRFTGTLAGGTGSRETQSMSISIKNLFQAKYLSGSGEEQKENQIDFLTWNISTRYNFSAEEQQWGTINSTLRASLGRQLGLDISMTHDPYKFETNELIIPRLTRMGLRTSFNISGSSFQIPGRSDRETPQQSGTPDDTTAAAADTLGTETDFLGAGINGSEQDLFSDTPRPGAGKNLWTLRMSLNYDVNKVNPNREVEPTFWLNTNGSINLSRNWAVSVNSRFDLTQREMVSTDISIHRNLHCWEMSFQWTPTGFGKGYYLRINVLSSTLQDLKVESRGGRQNRYGY